MTVKPFSMAALAAAAALLLAGGVQAAQQSGVQDRNFVAELAQGNTAEIQLAQLAEQRATNPQVKAFAQRLAADHSNLQNQIRSLASSCNIALPSGTTPEQQSMASQLSSLSGQEFDRQYIQLMLQEHQKDISKVQQQLTNTQDPAIQDLARKALPVLENHIRMAENIAGQMGISCQPGLNPQP